MRVLVLDNVFVLGEQCNSWRALRGAFQNAESIHVIIVFLINVNVQFNLGVTRLFLRVID